MFVILVPRPPPSPSLPPSPLTQGKHARCKQYVGHSAHVTNVRFSHDDRMLVSVGGADMSVMVWTHSSARSHAQAGQSDGVAMSSMATGCTSDQESDTDSEEEGIYSVFLVYGKCCT